MPLVQPVGFMVNLVTCRGQFVTVSAALGTQREECVVEFEHEHTKPPHHSSEPVGRQFAGVPFAGIGNTGVERRLARQHEVFPQVVELANRKVCGELLCGGHGKTPGV
jgi:hypothetical protein